MTRAVLDLGLTPAMRGNLRTLAALRLYIEAGRGTITVQSRRTAQRYTYRLRRPPAQQGRPRPIWVRVLYDGTLGRCWMLLGTVWPMPGGGYTLNRAKNSPVAPAMPVEAGLRWVLAAFTAPDGESKLFAGADIWHEGRCGRCGRALTVPASVEAGIGPECLAKL